MTIIILAAGFSSRMEGKNKLLLPYKGKPLLLHAIENAKNYCPNITVITGYDRESILKVLPNYVNEVFNSTPEQGQDSSIYKGLEAVNDDVMIVPGDLPTLATNDFIKVEKLLSEHKAVRAIANGTPSHPVALSNTVRIKLLEDRPEKIKTYLSSLPIFKVKMGSNTISDIDTPTEYQAFISNT